MVASVYFALTALTTADLSMVIPISSSSFLFTALLSFLLLHEPLNWGILAGLAAAVGGLVVIR
jgi:drug/metabolite transporter (DMT)-like permease